MFKRLKLSKIHWGKPHNTCTFCLCTKLFMFRVSTRHVYLTSTFLVWLLPDGHISWELLLCIQTFFRTTVCQFKILSWIIPFSQPIRTSNAIRNLKTTNHSAFFMNPIFFTIGVTGILSYKSIFVRKVNVLSFRLSAAVEN